MSSIVTDSELIAPAFDKFLDGHPTRRELQKAFNKMGNNDSELMLMVDNLNLVCNCLCEKLNITRGELDTYVSKKVEEMKAWQEAQQKTQEQPNEQPNG